MSFRGTNEQHLFEPADIGLRTAHETCGVAGGPGAPRAKGVEATCGGGVGRSRREESDRARPRIRLLLSSLCCLSSLRSLFVGAGLLLNVWYWNVPAALEGDS